MILTVPVSIIGGILLLVIGGLANMLSTWFWKWRDEAKAAVLRREHYQQTIDTRMEDVEKQLALVSQAVVPISTAFQAILVKELTHFHTPAMDALLRKLGPPYTLTLEEEVELAAALQQRMKDMAVEISDSERDAAQMLPLVMKRVRTEVSAFGPVNLYMVSVPVEAMVHK